MRLLVAAILLAGHDASAFDHSHAKLAGVLDAFVQDGRVDYPLLKRLGDLDGYLAELKSVKPEEEKDWVATRRAAFWLNAYNAFTLKAVLQHFPIPTRRASGYPAHSIGNIRGVWDELWFEAAGRKLTLDRLERDVLLGELEEPRAHFALFQGRARCPKLRSEPYLPEKIDRQLDDDVARFLADGDCFRYEPGRRKVLLSELLIENTADFDRYDDGGFGDFQRKLSGLAAFVASRLPEAQGRALRVSHSMGSLAPDWTLNELPLNWRGRQSPRSEKK